jgi:hypothetical protein
MNLMSLCLTIGVYCFSCELPWLWVRDTLTTTRNSSRILSRALLAEPGITGSLPLNLVRRRALLWPGAQPPEWRSLCLDHQVVDDNHISRHGHPPNGTGQCVSYHIAACLVIFISYGKGLILNFDILGHYRRRNALQIIKQREKCICQPHHLDFFLWKWNAFHSQSHVNIVVPFIPRNFFASTILSHPYITRLSYPSPLNMSTLSTLSEYDLMARYKCILTGSIFLTIVHGFCSCLPMPGNDSKSLVCFPVCNYWS